MYHSEVTMTENAVRTAPLILEVTCPLSPPEVIMTDSKTMINLLIPITSIIVMQSNYEKIRGGLKSTLIILFVGFCKLLRNNILRDMSGVKFYLCIFVCWKQGVFRQIQQGNALS